MGDSLVTDMTAAVVNPEPMREGSTDSMASSPEAGMAESYPQEEPQQQKRKGGRKPIYATSEERKQRNRQAQAAFRERRTEYIKQLESTIKAHEETLHNLQNSHRNAADECLMLRYKNSLLERILLEKGIDVQAELHAKTGSPSLGPTRTPLSAHSSPHQGPLQHRAVLNRQQQRRSLQLPIKTDFTNGLPLLQPDGPIPRSPLTKPSAGSLLSSPAQSATRSPNFVALGQSVSPNFNSIAAQQQALRPQPTRQGFAPLISPRRPSLITNQPPANGVASATTPTSAGTGTRQSGGPSFYQTQFTDHMSQLEREYEDQADTFEHEEQSEPSAGPGPFPAPNFPSTSNMAPPLGHTQNPPFTSPAALAPNNGGNIFGSINNNLFDPYDPMLDADPFGLSASMHFPTMYESR